MPRLRLPLPERTGSDRDELRCPHGFVDRAYSVFLLRLRCCELLDHFCCDYCDQLVMRPPPLLDIDLWASPGTCPDRLRGLNRGYEPPGRFDAPGTSQDILGDVLVTCGGGPEGRAPMEVPDLRAALPNFWDPTPPAESPATVGSRAGGLATRIQALSQCRVHANRRRAGELTRRARTSRTFPWL